MIRTILPKLAVPIFALLLIGAILTPTYATAGVNIVLCSTDKNNPTTGNLAGIIILEESSGANCYLGDKNVATTVGAVDIHDAHKVNIVNTVISGGTHIINTNGDDGKIKFKDNYLGANVEIEFNDTSHLEVKDNHATAVPTISISILGNTTDILKVEGNTADSITLSCNIVNDSASCKHNDPEEIGAGNTYDGKNKGCPVGGFCF